jgi:hypothetical protein
MKVIDLKKKLKGIHNLLNLDLSKDSGIEWIEKEKKHKLIKFFFNENSK